MALSDAARALLDRLREEYVAAGHPARRLCYFTSTTETQPLFSELAAHGYVEPRNMIHTHWSLSEQGVARLLEREDVRAVPPIAHHHHGDVIMGDKYTTKIEGTNVGAVAIGASAKATGSVSITATTGALTQEQHRKAVGKAQGALVSDQDALDQLDARMFEALNQFLRLARDIQVEQRSLAEVQAKMKDTLDEVWAEQVAKGMKPQLLPKTLEVAGAIVSNPVMVEVAKKLIGG